MSTTPLIAAMVRCMRVEAAGLLALELVRADGLPWENITPGAHIDVMVPHVGPRQYSVMPGESACALWLGVQRDPQSRGGSRWIHDSLRPGDLIDVSPTRNLFALEAGDGPVCLVAGGIGITPLLAMAQALAATSREWSLHYCVRERDRAGFAAQLDRFGERVHLHVDSEPSGPLDLSELVQTWPLDTHFYCCGPTGMLSHFEAAMSQRPAQYCHLERFALPVNTEVQHSGSFIVELQRSGGRYEIPQERSILEVLLDNGVAVDYSCCSGVCGMCETSVLAGIPVHMDGVLTDSERASNRSMMICCSRAQGDSLTLDL